MIKVKTTKKCHQCDDTFQPFQTTDKYCSFKCMIEGKIDHKSTKKKWQSKQNQRKPIRKFSKKRSKQNQEYLSEREKFLRDPQNQICPITGNQTTEIHHKKGRRDSMLNNKEFWLAVSSEGHKQIHDNAGWSYENGYLIKQHSIA